MVDAQTNIVHIYNISDINQIIFWSLKGGGFGVIIINTFSLHKPIELIDENIKCMKTRNLSVISLMITEVDRIIDCFIYPNHILISF